MSKYIYKKNYQKYDNITDGFDNIAFLTFL